MRTLPLHRLIEDTKVRWVAKRRRYAKDGLDYSEALELLADVDAEFFPLIELSVERDEHISNCIGSPLGIRGQRPRRSFNAAQRRPIPSNLINFEERLRERDNAPVPA